MFREFEKNKVVEYLLENERTSNIPSKNWWSPVCWWNCPFKNGPFSGSLRIRPFNGPVKTVGLQLSPWAGVHRGYLHKASVTQVFGLQNQEMSTNVVDGPLPGSCSPIFSLKKRGPQLGGAQPTWMSRQTTEVTDQRFLDQWVLYLQPWEPTAFLHFLGIIIYNPYIGGSKPSFFHGFGVQGNIPHLYISICYFTQFTNHWS